MSIPELGDSIWSIEYQRWGKVIELAVSEAKVLFEDGSRWIRYRLLTFDEIIIPQSARIRFKKPHVFAPGQPVCVRMDKKFRWHIRAFAKLDGESYACVSSSDSTLSWWQECVPYDPTLLEFDAVEEKKKNDN